MKTDIKRLSYVWQITEMTPERCEGCLHPEVIAKNLTEQVELGRLTVEQAQNALIGDLEIHCPQGATCESGMRSSGVDCNYLK